jgi:hypothetical protein
MHSEEDSTSTLAYLSFTYRREETFRRKTRSFHNDVSLVRGILYTDSGLPSPFSVNARQFSTEIVVWFWGARYTWIPPLRDTRIQLLWIQP